MEPQQVFDTIVAHLRQQNKKSVDPLIPDNCKYRSSDGLMCAVGCLIEDDEYHSGMEGQVLGSLLEKNHIHNQKLYTPKLAAKLNTQEAIMVACRLQWVHDHSSPEKWEKFFQNAADDFNLIYRPKE